MSEAAWWAIALGAAGAIFGSFNAALILRWSDGRSVIRGRSECDACHAVLSSAELVPLLSALMSRGRCRRCGARIDPLHWQIELGSCVIGMSAGWVAGGPVGIAGALLGWMLLTLAVLDWRSFWLPDRLTAFLAIGGLASGLAGVSPSFNDRLIGGCAGFAALWLIATGYRILRQTEGMGGGDPKLLGATGLWIGWRLLPATVLIAGIVGLAFVAATRLRSGAISRDDPIPFGTMIAIAAYPVWLTMIAYSS